MSTRGCRGGDPKVPTSAKDSSGHPFARPLQGGQYRLLEREPGQPAPTVGECALHR